MDGRTRVDRIVDVLASLEVDVIALQEVLGGGPEEDGQAAALGAQLGMGWVMDSVRLVRGKAYGNVVLSRLPIAQTHQCNLSCDKREPRGCMRVDVDVHGQVLHVFNVHLGTSVSERRKQAPRLAEFVADREVPGPKVLLGDFNEWVKGLTSKTLGEMLEGRRSDPAPAPPTDLPWRAPDVPPRSHLRGRWARRGEGDAATQPAHPRGQRSPASRR